MLLDMPCLDGVVRLGGQICTAMTNAGVKCHCFPRLISLAILRGQLLLSLSEVHQKGHEVPRREEVLLRASGLEQAVF